MYIKLTLFKQRYMTSFQKPCTKLKNGRLISKVGWFLDYTSPEVWTGIGTIG